jgi:Ca-activated chloride channel family protein
MKTKLLRLFAAALVALPLMAGAKASRDVTVRAELDRGVLPADQKVTAVVKVTLDAPPPPEKKDRPPVNLCLVLDRSGSMSGQKIEKAKEAAIEAVRRLGPKDIVSLVMFDHEVETLVPAQSAANSEWIESRIRSITSRGNTAIYGGVSQGAAEVRKNAGGKFVSRIVLMSDGLANIGPAKPDDLGRLGVSLLKEGISVSTVGLGTDYNEDLMTKLAQNSDGNTYFVENSTDLVRVFNAELGEVLSVVAREVKIKIEFTGGVKPLRIIGREGVVRGDSAEVFLNQLYGGQEKYALIEVEVPPTAHEKTRDLCKASVSYDNLLTEKSGAASASAQAKFSREEAVVKQSANVPVQKEWYANRIAVAKDEAVELSDKGEREKAAQVLKGISVEYKKFAQENAMPAAAAEADQLNAQGDQVQSAGYDNVSRKAARAESQQTKSQQYAK